MRATTRTEHVRELREALALTPSNTAIKNHLAKVEAMADEEWPAHKARLDSMAAKAGPSVARMVREAQEARRRR